MCQRLSASRAKGGANADVKTHLDLQPYRFDVVGNRITGEHDQEKTPDSGINIPIIEIVKDEPDTFDNMGGWFVAGFGIGILLFMLGWVSYLIAGGK